MSGVLELLNTVLEQNDTLSVVNFLEACSELRCFYKNNESLSQVVSIINKLLNENKTRETGLKLLEVFLPQCSANEITGNIISWMQQSLRAVVQNKKQHASVCALDIFCSLLESSCQIQEVRPQIVSNVIPKFMDMAIHKLETEPKKSAVLLKCLEKCLINYGKSCGSFKVMLESHILKLFERRVASSNVAERASRCYVYLCLIGPGGPNMENYKTAWNSQQIFLIDAMHSLLDILFDNVHEIQSSCKRTPQKHADLARITRTTEKSPLNKTQQLTSRFVALARSLSYMLKLSFPTSKTVDTDAILSVVCRVLAVTCTTLQTRVSAEIIALMTQIPTLHVWSIKLLEALIHCCHDHGVKHSTIICKLLTQSLKWTFEEESCYGYDKPYSSIRVQTYDCLTTWLTIARSGSGIENYADEIKNGFISDISPSTPIVTLTLDKNLKVKGKANKRQRVALLKGLKQQTPKCLINKEANKEVCTAALKSLAFIFESGSTLLKAKFHKEMQDVIIKQLLKMQLSQTAPIPYSDDKCRLALYTALHSVISNFHAQCPPPFYLSSVIFNKGLRDPSLIVMQYCSIALRSLANIMCPILPGMNLVSEIHEKLRDDSLDMRQPFGFSSPPKNRSSLMEVDKNVTVDEVDSSEIVSIEKSVNACDSDSVTANIFNGNEQFKPTAEPTTEIFESVISDTSNGTNNASKGSSIDNISMNTDMCLKSDENNPKDNQDKQIVIVEDIAPSTHENDTSAIHPISYNSTETHSDSEKRLNNISECEYMKENGIKHKKLEEDNYNQDEVPKKKFKSDTNSDITAHNPSPDNVEEEEMILSFVDEV